MATTTVHPESTTKPEVFTRKASGLVRVMSPSSAFMYNVLTMGLIFPWTYLWAPGALPGGKIVWGILLAMLFQIPIAITYAWLSTALPRTGGDYVFQSRVFGGGFAFTIVMSGFVIWILQWVALSGWLLSNLGFASLFLGLGATLGNLSLSSFGVWFTTPLGTVIVSILNAAVAMWLLISGFKNYVKVQYFMFYSVLLAFATMLIVLFTTTPAMFVEKINAFAIAAGGNPNFYQTAVEATTAAGVDLNPPFALLATFLIAPIAWTSLQWAIYSVQQNGEIKDARSFKSQVFIILGSLFVTGTLLALLAVAFERAIGAEMLAIAGAGYWMGIEEATIQGFWLWPNIVAVAMTGSVFVVIIIGVGFILNSFQIVNNCYIGMTRIMVAMSLDRLLPEWVSRISEKRHTPVNAHVLYFLASIPVIIVYNMWGAWYELTLGVTFAGGYVIVMTTLAGSLLPYRAKEIFEASAAPKRQIMGIPLETIVGFIGFFFGGAILLMFMSFGELGLTSLLAYTVVFGVITFSGIWYLVAKNAQKSRGIQVEHAFKEIPPE